MMRTKAEKSVPCKVRPAHRGKKFPTLRLAIRILSSESSRTTASLELSIAAISRPCADFRWAISRPMVSLMVCCITRMVSSSTPVSSFCVGGITESMSPSAMRPAAAAAIEIGRVTERASTAVMISDIISASSVTMVVNSRDALMAPRTRCRWLNPSSVDTSINRSSSSTTTAEVLSISRHNDGLMPTELAICRFSVHAVTNPSIRSASKIACSVCDNSLALARSSRKMSVIRAISRRWRVASAGVGACSWRPSRPSIREKSNSAARA